MTPSDVAVLSDVSNPGRITETGALVIGGDHPGLGIVRSLGRRGIPVHVIDDQCSVSTFSRYTTGFTRVKDLRDERKTVEAVLDVGARFHLQKWVLFPTRDETVAAIARYRDELNHFFRVTTPEWDSVQWAWDKKKTYQLAEQLGIPCPRTFNPRSEQELEYLDSRLPLAIKPAVKENFFYATGSKAWRADTPSQLRDFYAKARRQIDPGQILVQEIIPGDGLQQYSHCVFFRDGEIHSDFVARRLRQHPHEFGRAATYVETVEMPALAEFSRRFLAAIQFHGIVEIEYKRDVRDGEFKLLDVNARTWGFHALGSVAGVDFPYLLFADAVGQTVAPCRGRAGVGWMRALTDAPTVLSGLLHSRLTFGSYCRSLRNTRIESVFSKEDPLPFFGELLLLPYLVTKKYIL